MAPNVENNLRKTWWMPLVCFGLAFLLTKTDLLRLAEARTLDLRTKYRHYFQPPPDPRIVIALFDDYSEANVAPWPVDRAWHGQLNKFLAAEKAAVVTWDVIFDSRNKGKGDEDMARETQRAIEAGTRIVVGAVPGRTIAMNQPAADDPTQRLTQIEGNPVSIERQPYAMLPFPEMRAAGWWGGVDVPHDADGLIREIPLIAHVGAHYYPSLSLQTLMVYLQVPAAQVRVKFGEAIYLTTPNRAWRIPIDSRGHFLLNYRYDLVGQRPDFPTYSYVELLVKISNYRFEKIPGAPKPPDLAGKIVFIGGTATGKADAGPTPLNPSSPRVLVHANALNSMLTGDYIQRASDALVWGLALLFAYAGLVGMARRSVFHLIGGTVLGAVGYGVLAVLLWMYGSWWLPVMGPLLGFTGLRSLIIFQRMREDQRIRQKIKSMFGTYVSPRLVERLIQVGQPPQLGGIEAEITAYFSDIQDFSGLAEKLPATRLVALMNEYLTACTDLIHEEGGTLDKYVGDEVVVMFGAPLPVPDHAYRACVAALRVQSRLTELRAKWAKEGDQWPPSVAAMRTRIGLNTGLCVVGNMGSSTRFNYTMMGDDVNLAARLESAAKRLGVYTLCSEATQTACVQQGGDGVVFRPLGRIVDKGRSAAVAIAELVGRKEDLTDTARECLDHFAQGLACFHARDWDGARVSFERSAALELNAPGRDAGITGNPSLRYLAMVAEYSVQAPPADWDGIYVMPDK
ncbi:MAG: adenylate/guanylate cyclase domain-containing protein [Opitutus sp.]|nr:adenylate/guanylate cyclase domain-containing protein [Opitutus sp.]